jgi:hypothetical protein
VSPLRATPAAPRSAQVLDLAAARIAYALLRRARYRYVRPRVLPEGRGWRIVSPNCSRNIDAQGGEIDIAWFKPARGGLWRLHARDHAAGRWVPMGPPQSLASALAQVCRDDTRIFWP